MADITEKKSLNKRSSRPSCSVIIKHLPEAGDLYVGHNTWHEYAAMGYRVLKKYNMPFRLTGSSSETVPGHTVSMSSYAGTPFSLDDFVTISSGLVTTETTLNVYNSSLFRACDPASQVFEPIRVMVANRLANNAKEWTEIVARYNSGTYNNQWMIVDYNKLSSGGLELEDGLLWVYEQLPGLTVARDQTPVLREQGSWGSYNRAFYPETAELSGQVTKTEKFGDYFSHANTARANIMRRDHVKIKDEDSMILFMRYNNYTSDPFALFAGCSGPNPAGSIANRLDLGGGECVYSEIDPMVAVGTPYGALDMKFTNRYMLSRQEFMAVAGPTHGAYLQPFDWNKTNLKDKPDYMPISLFDFQPFRKTWHLQPLDQSISALRPV